MAESSRLAAPSGAGGKGYFRESRRPLVSLAFVAPLLIAYEGGVIALGHDAVRNGVDVWLRGILDTIGFGHYFLLPVLTVALLLAWHHATRDRWQVSALVLYGMTAECCALACVLIGAGYLQCSLTASLGQSEVVGTAPLALGLRHYSLVRRLVGFFGAGIYEEVLFRLMLLPASIGLLSLVGIAPRTSRLAAVAVTSVLFSLAHHVGPQGESFEWFNFVFRALAGGFFCGLFVCRGFGIAAGTHAIYDIMAGLL